MKLKPNKDDKTDKWSVLKIIFTIFGGVFLLFVALLAFGVYHFFFDMDSLPKGEYLTEEISPDGKYTLKAYVTNGGATVDYSVRGELIFNEDHFKTKNIYWNYHQENAEISWTDHDTVVINGRTLHVPNETYDFRND